MLRSNKSLCSTNLYNLISNTKPAEVQWVKSKDGYDVGVYNNIRLHSTYNVGKESLRAASTVPDGNTVVALGLSCGYHLSDLAANHRIIGVVLDYGLFANVSDTIDMSFLKNAVIIDKSELYRELYLALSEHSANVSIITSEYMLAANRKVVSELAAEITAMAQSIRTEINTIAKFGFVWQHNIDKNIKRYFDGKLCFDDLVIDNRIILVCGAGYSLTQNIDFIKANRECFYIVATDTSSLVLVRAGIYPDSIFSFDAQNISYKHFFALNDIAANLRLFVDFTSPVNFCSQQVKTTLLFSSHPYGEIFKAAGWTVRHINSGCGNIGWATTEFFADNMPEVPLVTVGLDYACFKQYGYAKNSYLFDYCLTEQTYFQTANALDAKLFYRSPISMTDGDWSSTQLLAGYARQSDKTVLTLSDSPFCNLTHISQSDVLALRRECSGRITFGFTPISQAKFNQIKSDCLLRDNRPQLPFLMWEQNRNKK